MLSRESVVCVCSNKNWPRVMMSKGTSQEGSLLASPVMPHMEVLQSGSELVVPMPALENSELHSDTEESSQESDQGNIPEGPTFHLNSK